MAKKENEYMTAREIARHFKTSYRCVRLRAERYGVKPDMTVGRAKLYLRSNPLFAKLGPQTRWEGGAK